MYCVSLVWSHDPGEHRHSKSGPSRGSRVRRRARRPSRAPERVATSSSTVHLTSPWYLSLMRVTKEAPPRYLAGSLGAAGSVKATILVGNRPGSNQYLQLSSDTAAVTPGSVTQVVHTTARSRYLLQWEMGGNPQGPPTVKTMHVLWDNKVVDVPTFSTKGLSASGFGANSWVHMKISVTATSSKSTIEFVDTFDTGWGAWVDSVSLNLESATVNGFQTTMSSDPYSAAVRQMLTKVPGSAVVPASGVPVCTLQALAAEQVKNGAGLLIIWTIAPSSQFIKMPSTTRLAKAQVVEQYLTDLLTRSRSLYLAALQADRVPLQGNADFASWWGVRVESRSTTGLLMNFQIAKAGKASTITWSNVVGVTSTSASAAPEALANLLYYTKKLAVLPGSTSTT